MSWVLAELDLPIEAISVLVLMLLSFLGWLKDRFFTKPDEEPDWEDEEMREVIWRRQTGQETELPPIPGRVGPPPLREPTIHVDQPKSSSSFSPPQPALPPALPELSDKELELANAFENITAPSSRRRKNGHRGEIDRLLRSPSAAQNAILLTEILGPPLAMREETGK